MALLIFDRVQETSTTTGTGPFTLGGAKLGFETFAQNFAVNDTTYYTIQNLATGEWEVGLGTYSAASTLTRTTVLHSSNANTAVNFGAGTKDVFVTAAAAMLPPNPVRTVGGVAPDASGNIPASGFPVVTNTARGTAIANTLTVVGSYPVNANAIVAGSAFRVQATMLLTNTTAAGNLSIRIQVGAVAVNILTQGTGTTARTNAPLNIDGYLIFTSPTTAEAYLKIFTSVTVINVGSTTATTTTVVTNTATSVNLAVQSGAATTTLTLTQLLIERLK